MVFKHYKYNFNICVNHSLSVTCSIDATDSHGLCRLVNDGIGKQMNCVMKKIIVDGTPYLCLFALRDIRAQEELRYDYGQTDMPWRLKVGLF